MQNKTIAIGDEFGFLRVLEIFRNEKGYIKCRCICQCGNEKEVYATNLKSGRTKSCGCLEAENRNRFVDLAGQVFGRLTALHPTQSRKDGCVVWLCRCACGQTVEVSGRHLTRGFTKSCGCLLKEKCDIAGRTYGLLTALYPDPTSPAAKPKKWICRCACSSLCSVSITNLNSGHTRSCGCLQKKEARHLVEGTCLEIIASQKVPRHNRSGIKGVSRYNKTGHWVATLTFQGKHHYLGRYYSLKEAAKARQLAEKRFYGPVLETYGHLLREK